MADICDLDELTSFKRREGMFGAAYACLGKAIGAAQMVLAGYLLVWGGIQGCPHAVNRNTVSPALHVRFGPNGLFVDLRNFYFFAPG